MKKETTISRKCGTCTHFKEENRRTGVCHVLIPEWVSTHYETGDEIMTPDEGTHCSLWSNNT